jgi:hypothetical protein
MLVRAAIGLPDGTFVAVTNGKVWKVKDTKLPTMEKVIREELNNKFVIGKMVMVAGGGLPFDPIEYIVRTVLETYPEYKLLWEDKIEVEDDMPAGTVY